MNLDQLEVLEAVVELGSFRAAANKLNKTQPSLSISIKNLEEELNIQIFNRDNYRPKLTLNGEVIYKSALETLKAARSIKKISHDLGVKKVEAQLRISIDQLADLNLIKPLLQHCSEHSFFTELIVKNSVLTSGLNDLLNDECDLAFALNDPNIKGIDSIPIAKLNLLTVYSKKIFLKNITKESLIIQKVPQILVYTKDSSKKSDPLMPHAIHNEDPKVFVEDHYLKLKMIREGLGWGRVAEHEIKSELDKSLFEIKSIKNSRTKFELCLMKKESTLLGPIASKVWQMYLQNNLK